MSFKPRLTKPEKGNKYYITKAKGGYSSAIEGKPTDKDCNVLSNCVGYAYGRFNEIGGYGCCKLLSPVNAENFMQYKGDCQVGQAPKLGAVMVWQKGNTLKSNDGAGHVAIVEQIISNTEIVTSESGYGCKNPFWMQKRNKGNGNWGQGSAYKFLGFIYNPAVKDEPQAPKQKFSQAVQNWQKAAIADGFKFPKAGADGYWGNECIGISKKAVCKRVLPKYINKNLTRIVQTAVGVRVDGYFGNDTHNAVVLWQKKNGLQQDGCFGPACWKKLLGV